MPTNFSTKVNKRIVGTEELIINEIHTITSSSPYQVKLIEIPLLESPSSVICEVNNGMGYAPRTETTTTVIAGTFKVDYSTGYVTFNSADSGFLARITYYGRGSIVDATDINSVQTAINTLETEVETARGSEASLDDRLSVSLDAVGNISAAGTINLNQIEVQQIVIQNVAGDVATPAIGQIWFDTSTSQLKLYNGTSIVLLG